MAAWASELGKIPSLAKEDWPDIASPLNVDFPEVPETDEESFEATWFRFDLASRCYVKSGSANWGQLEFAGVSISNETGEVVKRAWIGGPDFQADAPPYDLTKNKFVDSSDLSPGIYKVDFRARWLIMAGGLVVMAFGSGGLLSLEHGPVWGKQFEPTPDSQSGEYSNSFAFRIL